MHFNGILGVGTARSVQILG